MTLRERFRKALFALFKEEILNEVKAPPMMGFGGVIRHTDQKIDFKEVSYQIDFDTDYREDPFLPTPFKVERALDKARRELFDEVVKHLCVDSRKLLQPGLPAKERMTVTLWVGKVKQGW